LLGAIAFVAYRRARRASRQRVESSPETDAVMWFLGGILVFWPIALAWVIHEYVNVENKEKYWLMLNIIGFLLMTLVPLGWEVYFLYGFVAAVAALWAAIWDED
jgi:hypothetical protein